VTYPQHAATWQPGDPADPPDDQDTGTSAETVVPADDVVPADTTHGATPADEAGLDHSDELDDDELDDETDDDMAPGDTDLADLPSQRVDQAADGDLDDDVEVVEVDSVVVEPAGSVEDASGVEDASNVGDASAVPSDDALAADDSAPDDAVVVDEVIVAEVVDETPYQQPAPAGAGLETASVNGSGQQSDAALSQEWHDIQASFVDDPRGAVERAAQAADTAVSALASSLRDYQASIAPSGTGTADAPDTEQLRTALRGYRILCQNLEEMAQQLPRLDSASR
jgi:hypothetical protein